MRAALILLSCAGFLACAAPAWADDQSAYIDQMMCYTEKSLEDIINLSFTKGPDPDVDALIIEFNTGRPVAEHCIYGSGYVPMPKFVQSFIADNQAEIVVMSITFAGSTYYLGVDPEPAPEQGPRVSA